MMYDGRLNQDRSIEFLRRLVKTAGRKVYLLADNLPVHHGKKVKAWVKKHGEEIELFFLPSYPPEYDPDELFNGALKREVVNHRGNAQSEKDFKTNVRASAMKLQGNCEMLRNLFSKKEVRYALAG